MLHSREPQPIILPLSRPRRVSSGATVLVCPLSASAVRVRCGVCKAVGLEPGDRFCGYCGVRLGKLVVY
jgi:hypothetical protein